VQVPDAPGVGPVVAGPEAPGASWCHGATS
jgi:hypothetical protein